MTRPRHSGLLPALAAAAVLGAGAAACRPQQGDQSDYRADADPVLAATQVDATTLSDQGGVTQSLVTAAAVNTQLVHASSKSQIIGAVLAFAPGSFEIDSNVTLGEGHNLATKANVAALVGGDTTVLVQSAARSVLITFAYDENSLVPFSASIPAPKGQGTMVVLALENRPGADQDALTFLPSSAFTLAGGFVTFQASSFGVYQAVVLSRAPAAAKEVTSTEKVSTATAPAAAVPDTFNVSGPTEALSGAHPVVTWDFAALADTYELALDSQDPACGQPYKTYPGLTATSQTVAAASGTTYVCVTAKNGVGATKQGNPGFKFQADATPPPVPGAPSCVVDSGVHLTCTWSPVSDAGGGSVGYALQIGTSPGGSDVFNGTQAATTYAKLVGNGKTLYAQVASVDALGNESAYSPTSAPVTTDP